MQPNIYLTKVHYMTLCNYFNKHTFTPFNNKPLQLQALLKKYPFRLDLVRLELDVLYMEELGNVDKLLKELIFLFTYSAFHQHHWFLDNKSKLIDKAEDFLTYLQDLLFEILLDIQAHKSLKKYQKVIQSYFPNSYYNFYVKGTMALRENDLKLAFAYFKKANKQKPLQENIIIQIQDLCQKLNKTKELKKYTKQHEYIML